LLLNKVLEANESALAKKVFVEMAIHPAGVCQPWFTSLFVDVVPMDYVNRIWDNFLYEGVAFLFRVAVVIFSSCKQYILDAIGREAVVNILVHPPLSCLPPNPDAFIELAHAAKVKDDDVRKQRSKMEAIAKRQTQSRTLSHQTGSGGIALSNISLPKA